jgi:hypothetical protein
MVQDGMINAAAMQSAKEAYLAAVAKLAEELRPRFASGELHAVTDEEVMVRDGEVAEDRIGDECAAAFRINEIPHEVVMSLLAVSPHAECMTGYGFQTPRGWLITAITWDVIACARGRRYYIPAEGECADPISSPSCVECGHLRGVHDVEEGCYCGCGNFRRAANFRRAEVQP